MADNFSIKFEYNLQDILQRTGLDNNGRAQQYVDSEVLRLSEPFIPRDTGALVDSGIINTQIGSGEVEWRTPYARRWDYQPANFQGAPQKGNYWFERMKQQYKDSILNGVTEIIKGNR